MVKFESYLELYGGYKNFPVFYFEITDCGFKSQYKVKAPNKTIARQIAKGELNPWVKIGKIFKVVGEQKRLKQRRV